MHKSKDWWPMCCQSIRTTTYYTRFYREFGTNLTTFVLIENLAFRQATSPSKDNASNSYCNAVNNSNARSSNAKLQS